MYHITLTSFVQLPGVAAVAIQKDERDGHPRAHSNWQIAILHIAVEHNDNWLDLRM